MRELDPEVFGTPDQPKALEALPLAARKVSEDGSEFTTTKKPGPFSNRVAASEGELSPTKVTHGHPEEVPLPTKLILPGGKEQPFVHFNYYGNIEVEGNKYLD